MPVSPRVLPAAGSVLGLSLCLPFGGPGQPVAAAAAQGKAQTFPGGTGGPGRSCWGVLPAP